MAKVETEDYMRVRDRGYTIDEEKVPEVLQMIRNGGKDAREALLAAAYQTYEAIADDIVTSIIYGLSYDYMRIYVREIPIDKNSFYGYRRKTISIWAIMHVEDEKKKE